MAMTRTFANRKEKDDKPSRARKADSARTSETETAPGLPYFLEGGGSEQVKQRIKVTYKPKAASSVSENEADAIADRVRSTSKSNEPPLSQPELTQSASSGSQLPGDTRAFMEDQLGADFHTVRVHADENANQLANSFAANALTKGEDIYFNRDQYDPASEAGRGVLAHELAHVVQQRSHAAGQVQFDLMKTMPVTLGFFEIEMKTRKVPRVGMEGTLRFFPDPKGPYSAQLGLIQAVNVTNILSTKTQKAGAPVNWAHVGSGAEAGRQQLMTTGLDVAAPGWFVDAQTAANPQGAPVGPNYIEHWGRGGRNLFGWLRSPTDWHETSLYDYPWFSMDVDFEFETVAKATDTQNIYGAILWGFQIRSGAVQNEYAYVTNTESATFNEALERFRGYYTHEPIVLYFDTDKDIPIPGEENKIRDVLDYLKRYPDVRINIDGYADERDTVAHNDDLAFRRAQNVRSLAVSLGVSQSRINPAIGFGETTQFARGALNKGTWRANRRVVISFDRTASTPIVMP
jgi:outer membrane protein OmpA-like peptidoglycan-associated protein